MNPLQYAHLLEKYNVPAPRYTSYPTVPYWDVTPSQDQWLELVQSSIHQAKNAGHGAAIYVHVPFCESLCTFCGCNTRITKNHAVASPYVTGVLKEVELYKQFLGRTDLVEIAEMHLGGGTPTFLSPHELQTLVEGITQRCTVRSDATFSIEVDPRVTTKDHFQMLSNLGFRRISFGVQDFAGNVQEAVNRVQSVDMVRSCVETARSFGFTSINFDLIYGLPFQTPESMEKTFDEVARLLPDRIAFYAYAHVPWIKPAHRKFCDEDLPSGAVKRRLYEIGRSQLERVGYVEIGMDHFALPNDRLCQAVRSGSLHRNFMGYMDEHVSPLLGFGTSAISDSWSAFIQNEKVVEKYYAVLDGNKLPILRGHLLTTEDEIMRRHILELMTKFNTDFSNDLEKVPILNEVATRLSELQKDGLVELCPGKVRVTESGRAFVRNIGMAFDARLLRKAPQSSLFSKSI